MGESDLGSGNYFVNLFLKSSIEHSSTGIIKCTSSLSNEFLLIIFRIHLYIQSHHSSVDTIDVLHSFLHSSLMPSVVKVVEPVLIVPSIIIMGLMGLVAHPTISNNIISLRIIGGGIYMSSSGVRVGRCDLKVKSNNKSWD